MDSVIIDGAQRDELMQDVFDTLDHHQRGFVSKVELSHILDAMQANSDNKLLIPEGLIPANIARDSKVTLLDLTGYLSELNVADLEELKWFAESVVKVESELKNVWHASARNWRLRVAALHSRDLHRYLLPTHPERVSRWLLLRTSLTGQPKSEGQLPGLGFTVQEVETLFAEDTPDQIDACLEKVKPFITVMELRERLERICQEDGTDGNQKAVETLAHLTELATSRELACLLLHEDTLGMATAMIRSNVFSQAVVSQASKLIMTIISHRVHENARDYEALCQQAAASFLEMDFQPVAFDFEAMRRTLSCTLEPVPSRASLHARSPHRETVADWVGSLITKKADFDRGEMLDMIISYDERRLLTVADGGDREDAASLVPVSLFSHGRIIPLILSRLDVSSHHSFHEHRTPMRTHLWKLLLNVISSAGWRGRQLFRAGDGMHVVCSVLRGSSWGVERSELSLDAEEDIDEEEELSLAELSASKDVSWGLTMLKGLDRYYAMDFLDDKFYGSKDRDVASTFLEYMASDDLWGLEGCVEEMERYPNTLQVMSRVQPRCAGLLRLLLKSPSLPIYLQSTSRLLARHTADQVLRPMISPNLVQQSMFPFSWGDVIPPRSKVSGAFEDFREAMLEVGTKNFVLRLLANTYHNLRLASTFKQPASAEGEADTQEQIAELSSLVADQLPLAADEVIDIAAAVYLELKEFMRKAILAANPLQNSEAADANLNCFRGAAQYLMGRADTQQRPLEFLVMLRLIQLLRLRNAALPGFVLELQAFLEQITGESGSALPTATVPPGLVQPLQISVHEIPLRRSLLSRFPRQSPFDVITSLEAVFRELDDLAMATNEEQPDLVGRQRLLAVAANHICYFNARDLCLEDSGSSTGLAARFGVNSELLREVKDIVSQDPFSAAQGGAQLAAVSDRLPASCQILRSSTALIVLEVNPGSQAITFVGMAGTWRLWANGLSAATLTDCSQAAAHFGL